MTRPIPFRPSPSITFRAWRNDRPVETPEADSIDELARLLAPKASKGDVLTIHMTDAGRNKQTVAFYAVRASSKRYTWRAAYDGGRPVKVPAMEPHLLHAMDVRAFEPVAAFDALRDCPVGVDRQLVQGRG